MSTEFNPNRPLWFSLNIYPVDICFCATEKAWTEATKKLGTFDYPTTSAHTAMVDKDGHHNLIIVTMGERTDTFKWTTIIELCAHEAVHVWDYVKQTIEEKDTRGCSEIDAYHIGLYAKFIFESYIKTRRPIG